MTFPLPTLAAQISETGITAPSYADILSSLQASFRLIYGADVYLGNDTQDGQLLAVFARALSDHNEVDIAVYNQLSPLTAQGAGLSSIVKINGIRRQIASNSQVDLLIGGNVGTVITNGVVTDDNGKSWALPSIVIVPNSGAVIVTAVCTDPGSIPAPVGTINTIGTPTLGWFTVTNTGAASLGAPIESDAALRRRQSISVGLPAQTVLESLVADVETITGVTAVAAYENDTNLDNDDTLPPHSISLVVRGGDAAEIATAIMTKKTPGTSTYGDISVNVVDSVGIVHPIRFYVPAAVQLRVKIRIKSLVGYNDGTGQAIRQAVTDYINALAIGQSVYIARLYLPAQLNGTGAYSQFELREVLISVYPFLQINSDVAIAFNEQATANVDDVELEVLP